MIENRIITSAGPKKDKKNFHFYFLDIFEDENKIFWRFLSTLKFLKNLFFQSFSELFNLASFYFSFSNTFRKIRKHKISSFLLTIEPDVLWSMMSKSSAKHNFHYFHKTISICSNHNIIATNSKKLKTFYFQNYPKPFHLQ